MNILFFHIESLPQKGNFCVEWKFPFSENDRFHTDLIKCHGPYKSKKKKPNRSVLTVCVCVCVRVVDLILIRAPFYPSLSYEMMRSLCHVLLAWMLLMNGVKGHMLMSFPMPRGLPSNTVYGDPDYNLNAPVTNGMMCKGKPPGKSTLTVRGKSGRFILLWVVDGPRCGYSTCLLGSWRDYSSSFPRICAPWRGTSSS